MDDLHQSSARRPYVVLMLGEPGTGKTTLGAALARGLRVPFLARDDVRGGLFFTAGAWTERPAAPPSPDQAVEAFLVLIETMAKLGVSCVSEYVFREARPNDLERITRGATCIGVQTWCDDPRSRRMSRDRTEPLLQRPPVLEALGYGNTDEHLAHSEARMAAVAKEMTKSFAFPVLRVETNDGVSPDLATLLTFITEAAGTAA